MSVCQLKLFWNKKTKKKRMLIVLFWNLHEVKGQKLKTMSFAEQFSFWGKSPKVPPKHGFLTFAKNLTHCGVFFS